ncbi:DUF4747 family protein [Vibrio alginolyticus]|uniref:DUF4747 family protein n=1 Tax=Vibrio alginolyticus TaxID=663 RepID=UPI001BD5C170|nr:DUF4747 family protein [Vibrio alginolyticus]MBS9903211.1 DUF4747 family protein [Vibrio alginolyticus]
MTIKTLKLSALSIVTHPHSPQNYIKLFKAAEKVNYPVRLRGDVFGNIYHIEKRIEKGKDTVHGEFVKYTNIDKEGDWYSLATRDLVDNKEDLEKIKALPDHVKPNMSRFSFIFYPESHILVFENKYDDKTLAPAWAAKTLSSIFEQPSIFDKFGKVAVHVLPETDKIDEMLALDMRSITLFTHRPNPDATDKKLEARVKKRFAKLNIETEERTLKAPVGEDLKLDEEFKKEARVAAKNGSVTIKHTNADNRVVTSSTKQHDFKLTETYNADTQLAIDVLKSVGPKIVNKFKGWIGK